jgi:hypothetical protein
MAYHRVKAIAGACERIDDSNGTATGHWRDDLGDVTANLVTKGVFDSFEACAGEDAHTTLVPILWSHPIEMNVIGVVEAVASILFDPPP